MKVRHLGTPAKSPGVEEHAGLVDNVSAVKNKFWCA